MTTTAFTQGYDAGYAEAVERQRLGDADTAHDASTWFTAPVGQPHVRSTNVGSWQGSPTTSRPPGPAGPDVAPPRPTTRPERPADALNQPRGTCPPASHV